MDATLERIRKAVINPTTAWVVFQHGTVVFLPRPKPDLDLVAAATQLLGEWGPVQAGGPAGDFSVITLAEHSGWAVSSHHPDILTFLGPGEVESGTPEVHIGMLGRSHRDQDARELQVLHVEFAAGYSRATTLASLRLGFLDELTEETLEAGWMSLETMEPSAEEIAAALADHSSQTAGALALLRRPGPAGLEALWTAIDDDVSFCLGLVAVAACLDPEATSKARKRLLTHHPEAGRSETGARRTSCLQQLIWQDPDLRDWFKSRVDFLDLDNLERDHQGKQTRQDLLRVWRILHLALENPGLPAPDPQAPNLVELCWPNPWPGPLPEGPARAYLLENDPKPLARWLLAGGTRAVLDWDGCELVVISESQTPLRLSGYNGPIGYMCLMTSELAHRPREQGVVEVISQGFLYSIDPNPLQSSYGPLLVSGIDHDGKMRGDTAQALLAKAGAQIEGDAQVALTATDRSLGTVVITPGYALPACRYVAHVVSTPKHTPDSPGWLKKAVFGALDQAVRLDVQALNFTALGTNGGIAPEVAARVMLQATQEWHRQNRQARPLHVAFNLPARRVYEAFRKEFRQQKLDFLEIERDLAWEPN